MRSGLVRGVIAASVVAITASVLRRRIAHWGATDDELAAEWPGDELVAHPAYTWTNAITIDRPPESVWPWLVQLGQGRGGLYSYDWLENLIGCDVHSSDQIIEELQVPLHVGDRLIRMARYAPHNPIARVDPGRALVLGDVHDTDAELAAGRCASTWAFLLEPNGDRATRLVVRSRGSSRLARLQGPVQFVMQGRMMRGIKQRAEAGGSAQNEQPHDPPRMFSASFHPRVSSPSRRPRTSDDRVVTVSGTTA